MTPVVKASNAPWLAPGCHLDRYDLLLPVAEGGMGVLWLARQHGKHGFDRIVAIKTILPKLASDAGFQQMFLDEARLASRIQHPNVAQVLDLGEERGVLFLVMEWIDGESLINVGRAVAGETGAKLPVGILARVMVDACAGLHAAHELEDDDGTALGVVHRDVSPRNLLVEFGGTTKVIDFGIAKARNRMSQDTATGVLKGKLAYMAPEHAMGLAVDRRSDIWSAGASIYRLLAGCVPYGASQPLAVLRLIAEGRPPARLPATVPEPIRLAIERALEPDARKRFDTAHDMGAALEAAMRAADVYTTREDVAAFMAGRLGEARATRTREIEHAVRESRAQMRVERAHPEEMAGPALGVVRGDRTGGSLAFPAEWADRSPRLESPFAEPPRPSGRPTVVAPASGPSFGATGGPDPRPREVTTVRPGARGGGGVVTSAASIPAWLRVRALPSIVQWIAAMCLLGVLIVAGSAWHAARPSHHAMVPAVVASPSSAREPGDVSLPPPGPSAAVPAPDAPVTSPVSAHPDEQRAPSIPRVSDRGPTGDYLERARQARRAGRIGEAAALFAAAVRERPTDSEALTGAAEVAGAQGATTEAIVAYRHALAVNSRYLPARLGLADALWTSGQRDEARAVYRRIVDQAPPALCPAVARERAAGAAGDESAPR